MKRSSGAREVARLTALLRKAEMNASSMEEKIKQKVYSEGCQPVFFYQKKIAYQKAIAK